MLCSGGQAGVEVGMAEIGRLILDHVIRTTKFVQCACGNEQPCIDGRAVPDCESCGAALRRAAADRSETMRERKRRHGYEALLREVYRASEADRANMLGTDLHERIAKALGE